MAANTLVEAIVMVAVVVVVAGVATAMIIWEC